MLLLAALPILKELKGLPSQLANPKFMHHLLGPFLFWGLLIGVIAWMLSLWVVKNRTAQVCSLLLIAVSSFSLFPFLSYRKKAAPITAPSALRLNEQNDRYKDLQWVFYSIGGLAILGIFLTGEKKGPLATVLTFTIATGGLAAALAALYLQEKEISVFHEDARLAPPVAKSGRL